jgi:cell filamentation protein
MTEQSKRSRDRYDVSGNVEAQYVDAAGNVLRNKLGITDLITLQTAEEKSLALAYRDLLLEVRTDTPLTCDLLRHIHSRIFGNLYEWAGRWRTAWISKPDTTWPAPDFLDANMQVYERNVLRKFPAGNIGKEDAFCAAVGEIQGEFLVIHPFREGNARAIKLMTDLLAAQTGRPLLAYEQSEEGQNQYIEAARAAFKRDYAPMTAVIRRALDQARNRPQVPFAAHQEPPSTEGAALQ